MIPQTEDGIGHIENNIAARTTPVIHESAIGILGAVMLTLSATASARPSAPVCTHDLSAKTPAASITERFDDIRTRLQQRCSDTNRSLIEHVPGQPISQFGNWSDW